MWWKRSSTIILDSFTLKYWGLYLTYTSILQRTAGKTGKYEAKSSLMRGKCLLLWKFGSNMFFYMFHYTNEFLYLTFDKPCYWQCCLGKLKNKFLFQCMLEGSWFAGSLVVVFCSCSCSCSLSLIGWLVAWVLREGAPNWECGWFRRCVNVIIWLKDKQLRLRIHLVAKNNLYLKSTFYMKNNLKDE